MKKLGALILGMLLVVSVSGNALAAYEDGHLNMALYNAALNVEKTYDFGVIGGAFDLSTQNYALGTVDITDMLNVNVWSKNPGGQTLDNVFATATATAPGTTGFSGSAGFENGADALSGWNFAQGVNHDYDHSNSFGTLLGVNYGGWNLSPADGVINIGTIAIPGFIDMYAWEYEANLTAVPPAYEVVETAVIRLEADGDVILNPVVPVPAAVWMLGSALLGILGFRRKNS